MGGFSVPAGLSELVISKQLEQRFGLLGFARMIKLVELVADVADPLAPLTAVVAWGDFLVALDCNQSAAAEFLAHCELIRAIVRGDEDGRLRVTLLGDLAAMFDARPCACPPYAGPVIYTTAIEWAEWFARELNCPPSVARDPYSMQLFRRWCATNVTTAEIQAAIELAIKAQQAPSPSALHEHIRTVRNTKIERARL